MAEPVRGEEVFANIKQDIESDLVSELMMPARALAHFILSTEGGDHIENCKEISERSGAPPLELLCLARGIELGFIFGFSAGDGKPAENPISHPQIDFTRIFEDMRTKRALAEAGLTEQPIPPREEPDDDDRPSGLILPGEM